MSVMPCTAKKGEAARPEMQGGPFIGEGVRHIDYVLTTRELGKMFRFVLFARSVFLLVTVPF